MDAFERRRHLHPVSADWEPPRSKAIDDEDGWQRPRDPFADLIVLTGGADALWRLHTEPLPDEPFDWSLVDERDRAFVEHVLERVDACCDELLDVEYRTIARRVLARVAARDPRPLRSSDNVDRCAAGLVWVAGRGSGQFNRRANVGASLLWEWFGVTSCTDRGRGLWRAAGFPLVPWWYACTVDVVFGDPMLLHSHYRGVLIRWRDSVENARHESRNWSRVDEHTVHAHAAIVRPVAAAKGMHGEDRLMIVLGLGHDLDDATFYALSIPDTHHAIRLLQRALDDPFPRCARP